MCSAGREDDFSPFLSAFLPRLTLVTCTHCRTQEMVSGNAYCCLSNGDLLNSSEPLLLSENVLLPGFQSRLLQPNAFLRKPSFLARIECCYWANNWDNTVIYDLVVGGDSIWNIFKVTDYNNYIYFISTLHWEVWKIDSRKTSFKCCHILSFLKERRLHQECSLNILSGRQKACPFWGLIGVCRVWEERKATTGSTGDAQLVL